jgi:spore coat protein CotH
MLNSRVLTRKGNYCLLLFGLLFTSYSAKAQTGDSLYNDSLLHEIRITFYETNYWDTLEAHYDLLLDVNGDVIIGAPKQYLPATIEIDGTSIDSVGVRLKGFYSNWGASSDKKPFKVDLNEFVSGTKYDGLKKFNLGNAFKDPTMLRDKLSLDMMRKAGIKAPRSSHARVYINNTYWGLYNVIEQIDKTFLKQNFAPDSVGNLYKNVAWSDLDWQGSSQVAYEDEFQNKTSDTAPWDDLINLIDVMDNTPAAQYEDTLKTYFDVPVFLTALAIDRFMNNWDSYMDHGRNFYIYNDPQRNKFYWIPWDYNLSFSGQDFDVLEPVSGKPVIEGIMNNASMKGMYLNIMCELLEDELEKNYWFTRINFLTNLIRQAVYDDTQKETSDLDFDENTGYISVGPFWDQLPGLKALITDKTDNYPQQITNAGHTCVTAVDPITQNPISITIYPNPSTGVVNVEREGKAGKDVMLTVTNMSGQVLQHQQMKDYYETLDLSNFSKGIYLLTISGNGFYKTERLILY